VNVGVEPKLPIGDQAEMNEEYEAEATSLNPLVSFASHAKSSFGKKKAWR
jgi:hypothetical protein